MSRSVIVKWFYASLIGLAGGLILLSGAGVLALGADFLVKDGPDVVGIKSTPSAWTLAGLFGLAVLVLVGSAVAMFVAWIGAVINTANLPDKTWCIVLLVVGLLGMVFIAAIAYVVGGPDGLRPAANRGLRSIDQGSGHELPAPVANTQHVGG
jgi:hypothetical protein